MSFPRQVTPEIMDTAGLRADVHREALEGLRRINQASHVSLRMLQPIAELARREKLTRLKLLDVACGGGDVPVGLAVEARKLNLQIDLTLLDRSPTALARAAAASEEAGLPCRVVAADAVSSLPAGAFDVITSSLFLHHLPDAKTVVGFLRSIAQLSPRQIVVSDLRRCRAGFALAWIGCRVLSGSRIVHFDGPVSVRAAWTAPELANFAAQASMAHAQVFHCWPWRMLLVWENPSHGK